MHGVNRNISTFPFPDVICDMVKNVATLENLSGTFEPESSAGDLIDRINLKLWIFPDVLHRARRGDISDAKWSSFQTVSDPFGETFGIPSLDAVATKHSLMSSTAAFISAVSIPMMDDSFSIVVIQAAGVERRSVTDLRKLIAIRFHAFIVEMARVRSTSSGSLKCCAASL